jgi:hypothetical protein
LAYLYIAAGVTVSVNSLDDVILDIEGDYLEASFGSPADAVDSMASVLIDAGLRDEDPSVRMRFLDIDALELWAHRVHILCEQVRIYRKAAP